jgi:hypothetical protein
MNNRYCITVFHPQRIGWLEWNDRMTFEIVETKEDLDTMIACILEDASIDRAFYEDLASRSITHIKSQGKPFHFVC